MSTVAMAGENLNHKSKNKSILLPISVYTFTRHIDLMISFRNNVLENFVNVKKTSENLLESFMRSVRFFDICKWLCVQFDVLLSMWRFSKSEMRAYINRFIWTRSHIQVWIISAGVRCWCNLSCEILTPSYLVSCRKEYIFRWNLFQIMSGNLDVTIKR